MSTPANLKLFFRSESAKHNAIEVLELYYNKILVIKKIQYTRLSTDQLYSVNKNLLYDLRSHFNKLFYYNLDPWILFDIFILIYIYIFIFLWCKKKNNQILSYLYLHLVNPQLLTLWRRPKLFILKEIKISSLLVFTLSSLCQDHSFKWYYSCIII